MALAHHSCTSNVITTFPEMPPSIIRNPIYYHKTNIIIGFVLDVTINLNWDLMFSRWCLCSSLLLRHNVILEDSLTLLRVLG